MMTFLCSKFQSRNPQTRVVTVGRGEQCTVMPAVGNNLIFKSEHCYFGF